MRPGIVRLILDTSDCMHVTYLESQIVLPSRFTPQLDSSLKDKYSFSFVTLFRNSLSTQLCCKKGKHVILMYMYGTARALWKIMVGEVGDCVYY
jgi:hypothetical protein